MPTLLLESLRLLIFVVCFKDHNNWYKKFENMFFLMKIWVFRTIKIKLNLFFYSSLPVSGKKDFTCYNLFLIFTRLRLFQSLRLLNSKNFPMPTFIKEPTSIRDLRVHVPFSNSCNLESKMMVFQSKLLFWYHI